MIQTDGLAQALAFLKAKGKGDSSKPHSKAFGHLQSWLNKPEQFAFKDDLFKWLIEQDSASVATMR